jgi:hypothetical protein
MTFKHWWAARAELSNTMHADIEAISHRYNLPFESQNIVHPKQMQWLELEQEKDFMALLEDESEAYRKNDFTVKIIPLGAGEVLRVRLHQKTGRLTAEVKVNIAYVDGLRLRLVRAVTRLEYGPDLELLEGVSQMVRISGLKIAVFKIENGQMFGAYLQGHTLAKTENVPRVFQTNDELCRVVKGLESHFVNPHSDYDYQTIVEELQIAIDRLKNLHADGLQKGVQVLDLGRSVLKDLFPNDKLLKSLVSTLSYYIQSRSPSKKLHGDEVCQIIKPMQPSGSINSSPNRV